MSIIIGIDLGTTNSAAAYLKRGKVEIIPIDGKNTMPSVLSVRNGEVVIGQQAKSRLLLDPKNSVASSKRDIGTNVKYQLGAEVFTPEDVAYEILKNIKMKASEALRDTIEEVVVTVPAYFTSEQREITKSAAERAGLKVLRLVPEPTAAALDYGIDQNKNQTLMVYDLGGGTFDISILKVNGNNFEILAVEGDSRLGGDDFDEIISGLLCKQVNEDLGLVITLQKERKYLSAIIKIKEAAEKAKIDLSDMEEVEIILPNLIDDYCLEKSIARQEFNRLAKPLMDRTIVKVNKALKNINYTEEDIDRVILVGGSTKMPIVRQVIKERIKDPYIAPNVDEVVARGAAFMATSLATPEYQLKSGIDLTKKINVKEKTVFTYGVDMLNQYDELFFKPIVKKGSLLPVIDGVIGFTARPYQEEVLFKVFRGDDPKPDANEYLGELLLEIKNPSEGQLPVLALFEIDENMIIHFTGAQIPVSEQYRKIIECGDIKTLKVHLGEGKIKGKEVLIEAKEIGGK